MSTALLLIAFACRVYLATLLARMIFDWLQVLARGWRPSGWSLILANAVYAVTDPPLKALRRVVKPVSLGGISLDLAFLIVFLIVAFLPRILLPIALSMA